MAAPGNSPIAIAFEGHLNLGRGSFRQCRRRIDELLRALGIGPIQHFNPVTQGTFGGDGC